MKTNKTTVLFRSALLWMGILVPAMAQTPATVSADQPEVVQIGSGNATFSAEGGSTVSPDEACYTKTGNKRYTWIYDTLVGTPTSGATSSSSTLQIQKAIVGDTSVKVKLEEEYSHNDTGTKVWVSAGLSTTDVKHANVDVYTIHNEISYFGAGCTIDVARRWRTLTFFGVTGGAGREFSCDITLGSDKIDIGSSVSDSNGNPRWSVSSKKPSSTDNDVEVVVSFGEEALKTLVYTVNTSMDCIFADGEDSSVTMYVFGTSIIFKKGFNSRYNDVVRDRHSDPMPDLPVNESFGTRYEDMSNYWTNVEVSNGDTQSNGTIEDNYKALTSPGFGVPDALYPGESGWEDKVYHIYQYYRAGSTTTGWGTLVKDHTLQMYRGKGRQQ